MIAKAKSSAKIPLPENMTPAERGLIAAKAMSKALRAEHKRWNMPLISWKDGKVIEVKVK
ncbi:MAG: hypothetical protein QM627_10510 [Luteolibacter sp.]